MPFLNLCVLCVFAVDETKRNLEVVSLMLRPKFHIANCALLILQCSVISSVVQAAPPTNTPPPVQRSASGLISLSFKDGDVRDVLSGIGLISGTNIIADATVQGRMTLNLKNLTLDEAIRSICNIGGYNYVKVGDVYNISKTMLARPLIVEMQDGKLTIEATRSDLREVLQRIAQVAGKNIVPSQNVAGQVTFSVRNLPFEVALETFVAANGLTLEKRPAGEGQDVLYLVDKAVPKPPTPPEQQPSPSKPPTAGPPAPSSEGVKPKSDKVNLKAENRELAEILQDISVQTGVSFGMIGELSGKRTLRLADASVEESLESVFTGTKYWYVKQKGGYLIGDVTSANVRETAPFLRTEVIPLKYLKAEDAPLFLSALVPKDSVRSLKGQNAILITSTADVVERARQELDQIDIPAPQIMLQAILVEITNSYTKDLGIELSGEFDAIKGQGPTGSFLTFTSPDSFDRKLTATLTGLVSEGKARILANPRVATINGHQASIDIVQERFFRTAAIPTSTTGTGSTGTGTGTGTSGSDNVVVSPYVQSQIEKIQAGIQLEITPWVGADGDITVEVTPQVSNITGTGPEGLPELSTRTAKTTIRVKDGQHIIIGGLVQKEISKSLNKPWLLGDIPWLGKLFHHTVTNKRETELVILITPTILKAETGTLTEPETRPGAESQEKAREPVLSEPGKRNTQ